MKKLFFSVNCPLDIEELIHYLRGVLVDPNEKEILYVLTVSEASEETQTPLYQERQKEVA